LPLDFEIYGGQDEKSIDGNTGIFIKKIKEGSSLQRTIKIGDHILKVRKKRKLLTQPVQLTQNGFLLFSSSTSLVLYITPRSSMNLKISCLSKVTLS